MRTSPLLAFVLVALAAACDPYDPDLGDTPFLCGTDEPRCPEGYAASMVNSRCQCVATNADGPDGGGTGGPFTCNDDSAVSGDPMGNDTHQTATPTAIGAGAATAVFNAMSICPTTDVDVFRMNITQMGKRIDVRVQYDQSIGPLALELLDSAGNPVATGSPTPNLVQATYTAQAAGFHYAKVSAGAADVENNYTIQMVVSGP